jgi:hypothetical protein
MTDFISEEEQDRIEQFAETPLFERQPEQLLPDDGPDD